jgi:hypothetical protein
MKHAASSAATIVLAILGIRCNSVISDDKGDAEELASRPSAYETTSRSPSSPRDRPTGAFARDAEQAFAAPGIAMLRSVSRATGDDGASYVAGVFSGVIASGAFRLESQGADDVYLARIEPDGQVAWARSIGSKNEERDPRVTFEDGEVKVLAFTDGVVDCGGGALGRTWSSPMFFFCVFGSAGQPRSGGTFPTGNP